MADGSSHSFRPAVPPRRTRPAGLLEFLWIAWRDPLTMWSVRHFNEPFLYAEGSRGAVMTVSDPAGIRHVLLENARNFDKGRLQRIILGPLLAEGLLLVEGEDWRRARRMLAPLFTPARTAASAGEMLRVAQARVAKWLEKGKVATLDIDREMTGLTFDIISATLFSDMLGGEARRFEAALNSFLDTAARVDPLDVLDAPGWIPRLGQVFGGRNAAFFEKRVARLVADRRALIEGGGEAPDDLMTALLRTRDEEQGGMLSEREVQANILTFILAGHETTARTLGWTLHLLSRSPEVQAKVQAEADLFDLSQSDWADRMPWTRAVIEEALRLFPPAPTMTRRAREPDVICGQAIPAGTHILISPWVVQRQPRLWEDPEAFRPERFLPGAREKIDRFAFIPFSAGPRICIGAAFAMQEAMIALAVIIKAVDVEGVDAREPIPTHRITLRAKGGIRLRVRARAGRE